MQINMYVLANHKLDNFSENFLENTYTYNTLNGSTLEIKLIISVALRLDSVYSFYTYNSRLLNGFF